jgi:hypothetical protein
MNFRWPWDCHLELRDMWSSKTFVPLQWLHQLPTIPHTATMNFQLSCIRHHKLLAIGSGRHKLSAILCVIAINFKRPSGGHHEPSAILQQLPWTFDSLATITINFQQPKGNHHKISAISQLPPWISSVYHYLWLPCSDCHELSANPWRSPWTSSDLVAVAINFRQSYGSRHKLRRPSWFRELLAAPQWP